jgi:hypothetical protein
LTFSTTILSSPMLAPRLLKREPLRPRGAQVREIWVTPEINCMLNGGGKDLGFPERDAETLVGIFSAGWMVTSSFKLNDSRPDIERLEGLDEIWAFCLRKPPPGWRLLGRMIEKDKFIALSAWDKHALIGNYGEAARQVEEQWGSLFGQIPPLRGNVVSDYLSNVRDLDEKS